MGLFSILRDAAIDTNEQVHAVRLEKDLGATLRMVEGLPDDLRAECLMTFVDMCKRISREKRNWSRDGALQRSKHLFKAAREKQHLDRKLSIAYALAGLWLEGEYRAHPKAAVVHEYLDQLARELESGASDDESPDELTEFQDKMELAKAFMEEMVGSNPNAIDSDAFPGTRRGDFGLDLDNPIPCASIVGSMMYLDSLRLDGKPVSYTREGSHEPNFTGFPVDEYIVSSTAPGDHRSWRIFISPYQRRNSRQAPYVFSLADD